MSIIDIEDQVYYLKRFYPTFKYCPVCNSNIRIMAGGSYYKSCKIDKLHYQLGYRRGFGIFDVIIKTSKYSLQYAPDYHNSIFIMMSNTSKVILKIKNQDPDKWIIPEKDLIEKIEKLLLLV